MSFNEVIERIRDVLALEQKNTSKKIFDKDIAKALDISAINLASMKCRDQIPYSNILNFCAKRKISINWIFFNQNPSMTVENTDKYWIRCYSNVNASAGGGACAIEVDEEADNKIEIDSCFAGSLKKNNANLKHTEAISVSGDSMEPTLMDGDIVFIDKSKTEYKSNGIYVIFFEDALFIKRLKQVGDSVIIISDNPAYNDITTHKNNIEVIAKVVASFGSVF